MTPNGHIVIDLVWGSGPDARASGGRGGVSDQSRVRSLSWRVNSRNSSVGRKVVRITRGLLGVIVQIAPRYICCGLTDDGWG